MPVETVRMPVHRPDAPIRHFSFMGTTDGTCECDEWRNAKEAYGSGTVFNDSLGELWHGHPLACVGSLELNQADKTLTIHYLKLWDKKRDKVRFNKRKPSTPSVRAFESFKIHDGYIVRFAEVLALVYADSQ